MTQTQERELKRLRDAFKTADKDSDDLLNNEEFAHFVEIAYRKQCPPGMYQTICSRFKRDISEGIDWNTAKIIYVQANNQRKKVENEAQEKVTKEDKNQMESTRSASDSSSRSDSSHFIRQHSITMSQSSLISELEADDAVTASGASANQRAHRLQRASTLSSSGFHRKSRTSFGSNNGCGSLSFESAANDTSSMIVDILDQKNKSLQNKLMKERTKRKKTEEIAQSLLKQNEEYKNTIDSLQNRSVALEKENNSLNTAVERFGRKVDEDKNRIKYMREEGARMKSELEDAYNLWTKLEKEHRAIVKKLKQKHAAEMEKLYAGFLESLGIEQGKEGKASDVTTVIKSLKSNNVELKNTVATLAESLARKQRSLLEALQAVDNIAINDEKTQNQLELYKNKQIATETEEKRESANIKTRFKEWKQRRKSLGISRKLSDGLHQMKRRRKSWHEIENKVNAKLFKDAFNEKENETNAISADNVQHAKEMQFLSQKLSRDVANKTQSIENLSIANTVLFEKMQKMKQEMEQIKQLKDVYDQQKSASYDDNQ